MVLTEVNNAITRKQFLEVPRILYKNDPFWVCPLDMEIENIFNPEKNVMFPAWRCTPVDFIHTGRQTGRKDSCAL